MNESIKADLKAIFALPKWAKVFLAVLSVVAVAGLITAFGLKAWAADKVESGELVLKGIAKGWQGRLLQDENYTADEIKAFLESLDSQKATQENADENLAKKQIVPSKFAFDGRLYFARLDFLLRSKVIAYIDIVGISWGENVDKNAISDISSHNRWVKFITKQDLISQGLNAQNIGKVEYKMDFSPLFKTILKYYLIISLCLLGVLFLRNFLWFSERGEISFATQNSLPSVLWQGYKSINPLYRHTFWIVFIALNIVFSFHTMNFVFGNHDFSAMANAYMPLMAGSIERWSQNIISYFLQNNIILPVLNNEITFIALTLGSLMFCYTLNIPRKLHLWVICALALTLTPFTLSKMYYIFQSAGIFIGFAVMGLGFVFAKLASERTSKNLTILPNVATDNLVVQNERERERERVTCDSANADFAKLSKLHTCKNLKISIIFCILATLCFHWALATYQVAIDSIAIIFIGLFILHFSQPNATFKGTMYHFRFHIIAIILAVISYKIFFDLLKFLDIIKPHFSNQTISSADFLKQFLDSISIAFKNLLGYNYAFQSNFVNVFVLILNIALVLVLVMQKSSIGKKVILLALLCLCVIATQGHNFISKNIIHGTRVDIYGLLVYRFVVLGMLIVLCANLNSKKLLYNMIFIGSCIMIYCNSVELLHAQKIEKLKNDGEIATFYRMLARLETIEGFSYKKKYTLLNIGRNISFREVYLKNAGAKGDGDGLSSRLFYSTFVDGSAFGLFSGKNIFDKSYNIGFGEYKENEAIKALIKRLHNAGILENLAPYPHKNSIVIFENVIIVVGQYADIELAELKLFANEL